MKKEERIELVAKGLSGLCYGEFCEIFQELKMAYKVTKKELTPEEISSVMEKVSKRWN